MLRDYPSEKLMILIAAGSSLPFCNVDSQQLVLRAFSALGRSVNVTQQSSLYESPAWPDPNDPPFVNAVACIETAMAPEDLLSVLHVIEAGFGRRRTVRNAPRTLDLDLLAYGEEIRSGADGGLRLPHPGIPDRAFVLTPLVEIAPDWRHPETGQTAETLLEAVKDPSVRRIS